MDHITPAPTQQNIHVIAFRLDRRTFALPLDVIVQILPMMTITPIPHLSKIVKGTINVRGKDILAISLRSHFGAAEEELQLYTPLLLLNLHDRSLALIVDAVLDVMTLPLGKVTSLQNILPDGLENNPMLRGISQYNNEAVLVLDPDHLFDNQQILFQKFLATRTSVDEPTPVIKNTPIEEDTLVPVHPDTQAVKSLSAAESTSVVEDIPIAESAPVPISPLDQSPKEDE